MGAPIYGKGNEVYNLMHGFARTLRPGETFHPQRAGDWFDQNYPKIKRVTAEKHVQGMAVNDPRHRKHHPQIRPNGNWDLFYKVGPNLYRLWDPKTDPAPKYGYDA